MKPVNGNPSARSEETTVSAFGARVLRKLAAGARGQRAGSEGYRLSGIMVPQSLVEELRRKDLVCVTYPLGIGSVDGVDGIGSELKIADPGIYYVRRREAAQTPKREVVRFADRYALQHQLQAPQPVGQRRGRKAAVGVGAGRSQARRNLAESPLGWLASRKDRQGHSLVEPRQIEAADALRSDFELSASSPRLTASYDGVPTSGGRHSNPTGLDPTEAQMAAKARLQRALDHVGPGLSDILVRVCCHLEGMEQAEKGMGWPSRSAKVVLLIALDRLADHYWSK